MKGRKILKALLPVIIITSSITVIPSIASAKAGRAPIVWSSVSYHMEGMRMVCNWKSNYGHRKQTNGHGLCPLP